MIESWTREARAYQDLHCLSMHASICDTDIKCSIHFFRIFLFLFYFCHIVILTAVLRFYYY